MSDAAPSNRNQSAAFDHAIKVIHEEEMGDFYRTGRSSAQTKLANVRSHDHGKQELAFKHIVHHKEPTNTKLAMKEECDIEHVHEHRSLLSDYTL